ncbi:MAG: metal ion permease [Proteobacteria bacterium]|nr:metal ion permease [Pseudomonadota bacterium]
MEGLFSLLVFALFFYFMMRLGCGTHTTHGSDDEKHSNNANDSPAYIDPVNGQEVADDQGYGKLHDGKLYRFITRDNLDAFDRQPEKYIQHMTKTGE